MADQIRVLPGGELSSASRRATVRETLVCVTGGKEAMAPKVRPHGTSPNLIQSLLAEMSKEIEKKLGSRQQHAPFAVEADLGLQLRSWAIGRAEELKQAGWPNAAALVESCVGPWDSGLLDTFFGQREVLNDMKSLVGRLEEAQSDIELASKDHDGDRAK